MVSAGVVVVSVLVVVASVLVVVDVVVVAVVVGALVVGSVVVGGASARAAAAAAPLPKRTAVASVAISFGRTTDGIIRACRTASVQGDWAGGRSHRRSYHTPVRPTGCQVPARLRQSPMTDANRDPPNRDRGAVCCRA